MSPVVYVDADACPVKAEVYKVAARFGLRVEVVANQFQQVPQSPSVEFVIVPGFGAVNEYIAKTIGPVLDDAFVDDLLDGIPEPDDDVPAADDDVGLPENGVGAEKPQTNSAPSVCPF